MPRPEECRFSKEHEWVYLKDEVALIGITDFAQQELGDIVYVDLGEAGRSVSAGDEMGTIESVKAVAEIYAPVSGEIVEINEALTDSPEKVNEDALGEGWLVRIKVDDSSAVSELLDHDAYQKFLESESS